MSALDELLKKHRKKIIDREKKTFRELLKAYQEIEKDLSKSFKKLENEMKAALESGEEIDPSWLYNKKRLKKLLEQTNEQIIRFGGKAAKIIESEQQKAIEIAAEQSKEVYKFLLNQTPDASAFIPSLNTRNVETAVGLMGDKSPLISYFAETLAPDVAEKIRSEVIKATAFDTPYHKLAKSLQEAGDITSSRALSVARTEVSRVRNAANLEYYRENEDRISGWQWVAGLSRRTCPLCLAMDGKIFPLSEPFPQHVNCRCRSIPVLNRFGVQQRVLGKDWFEEQPDDVKKQILGKEAFEQYQAGNVGLDDFVAFRNDKRFGKSVTRRPLAQILSEKGISQFRKEDFSKDTANLHLLNLPTHRYKTRFYISAGELLDRKNIIQMHPLDERQLKGYGGNKGVLDLTNEELLRFGGPKGDDPISGFRENATKDDIRLPGSLVNIRGGHHRLFVIAERVKKGIIDRKTLIEFLIKEDG